MLYSADADIMSTEPSRDTMCIYTAPWYPGDKLLRTCVTMLEAEGFPVDLKVVDVKEDEAAAERDGVMCVPTAIVFRDGGERRRLTGALGPVQLSALVGKSRRSHKIVAPQVDQTTSA